MLECLSSAFPGHGLLANSILLFNFQSATAMVVDTSISKNSLVFALSLNEGVVLILNLGIHCGSPQAACKPAHPLIRLLRCISVFTGSFSVGKNYFTFVLA